jgi:hypothetical protein
MWVIIVFILFHVISGSLPGKGGASTFIIDRLEGEMAVIEWENGVFNLPRELLPLGAREGDVLQILIEIDNEAKKKRLKIIEDLMQFDE